MSVAGNGNEARWGITGGAHGAFFGDWSLLLLHKTQYNVVAEMAGWQPLDKLASGGVRESIGETFYEAES